MNAPTIYRQDAFTIRNLAEILRHFTGGAMRFEGFTRAGTLREATAWTGKTYARDDFAGAAADMDALLIRAEAAPSMTAQEAMARLRRR